MKDILRHKILFITGIDTDAGKTYATGALALQLMSAGKSVITQKFIQTGCKDISEDIVVHRKIMKKTLLPEDIDHTTAPIIFTYPASAQLAAKIDGTEIDISKIEKSTEILSQRYDTVLIEGAGGVMVPVTDDFFTIDYIKEQKLPVVVVTNGVLGSINHTVLTLESLAKRDIHLAGVIYNHYFDNDKIIAEDTCGFIKRYVERHFPHADFIEID